MKAKCVFRKMLYALFSGVLVLLGFSCSGDTLGEDIREAYGTPYAKHGIKGKVVDKEAESAGIENIQVVVRSVDKDRLYPGDADTLFTDQNGEFYVEKEGFKLIETYRVYYEEVTSENSSPVYKEGFVDVDTEQVVEQGKNWYEGKSIADVIIRLEKNDPEGER
ncbi:MAG: radical SAM-associated putative lipoprotein [Bacteroides sp.]|nr:radical SAM-associated putative lipoprotein [Bacteroides sp.]